MTQLIVHFDFLPILLSFQVSLACGKNYDNYFNKASQGNRQLSQVHQNSGLRTNN